MSNGWPSTGRPKLDMDLTRFGSDPAQFIFLRLWALVSPLLRDRCGLLVGL
jgi:hypothetical protein